MLKPSSIHSDEHGTESSTDYRTSQSAYIYRHQTPIVRCIERKLAQFQGAIDIDCLEPFQIVKYIDNQQVKYPFDYFHNKLSKNIFLFIFYFSTNLIMIGLERTMLDLRVAKE